MLVAFGLEPASLQPRLLQPRGLRGTPVPHPTARVQIRHFLPRAPGGAPILSKPPLLHQ